MFGSTVFTAQNVKIAWDTNENSNAQIEYGTSACPCPTQTSIVPHLVKAHRLWIMNLQHGTTYHYRVKSRDSNGNLAVSSDKTLTMP